MILEGVEDGWVGCSSQMSLILEYSIKSIEIRWSIFKQIIINNSSWSMLRPLSRPIPPSVKIQPSSSWSCTVPKANTKYSYLNQHWGLLSYHTSRPRSPETQAPLFSYGSNIRVTSTLSIDKLQPSTWPKTISRQTGKYTCNCRTRTHLEPVLISDIVCIYFYMATLLVPSSPY